MPLALTDHAGNSTAGIHLHGLAHALRCLGRLSGRPSASCDGGALVGCRPTLQNRSRAWATVCHAPEESAQDGTSLLHSTTTTERLCCRLGAIECATEPTVMWHARLTCRGLARRCAFGGGCLVYPYKAIPGEQSVLLFHVLCTYVALCNLRAKETAPSTRACSASKPCRPRLQMPDCAAETLNCPNAA